MIKTFLLAVALMPLTASASVRDSVNFNFDWLFHPGELSGAELTDLDDSQWRAVDLPHDFQIEQPWVAPTADETSDNSDQASNFKSRLSARGFKEMGTGWYRKTFTPDESWKGRRVLIDFEGIMLVGDVYLNGEHIGKTDYGYLGFDADISRKLRYGESNVIAVRASTGEPLNSRWYTGGGLFRDIHLIITDPRMYFTRHSTAITTSLANNHEKATINIQAEMACMDNVENLHVAIDIRDPQGKVVAHKDCTHRFFRNQRTREYQLDSITLPHPQLWDVDSPHLYTAELTLTDDAGTEKDRIRETFGIRSIEYSPDFGLKLNGRKILLKGLANHHSLGDLGAAAYPRAIEKRLQLIKAFGYNHVRTSHNPYSKSFLDLCDRYGILVVDELYDKWLDQFTGGREPWMNLWQHDIPEFVKRDRNHPCVVMWSLGNELQTYWNLPFADWGVTPYRMQKSLLRRYDTSRPITVAMHPRGRSQLTDSLPAPLALETDIAAYNYRYMYFPGDSRRYPHLIFYQSEANTSNMGPNFFEMDLDKVVGLAYWGAIDYLGESQGWPAKGWAQGVFDLSLQPKPIAYLVKSMFTDEPIVHIGIIDKLDENNVWNGVNVGTPHMSESWNRQPGSTLSLFTYTNTEEVELVVNGKSIGRKSNSQEPKQRDKLRWDGVEYAPGYIEAIGRNGGQVVARHRIETTGEAVALQAEADNSRWLADGTDLQHIRIHAIDSKGRRVYDADQKLSFTVTGNARIAATSNGDIVSDELSISDSRQLFHGSALLILRAGRTPSPVELTISAPGLKPLKMKLKTNKVE